MTIIKINFAFSGMNRTVTESVRQDHCVRYQRLQAILLWYKGKTTAVTRALGRLAVPLEKQL
jgi:hypothetical protein